MLVRLGRDLGMCIQFLSCLSVCDLCQISLSQLRARFSFPFWVPFCLKPGGRALPGHYTRLSFTKTSSGTHTTQTLLSCQARLGFKWFFYTYFVVWVDVASIIRLCKHLIFNVQAKKHVNPLLLSKTWIFKLVNFVTVTTFFVLNISLTWNVLDALKRHIMLHCIKKKNAVTLHFEFLSNIAL